MDTKQNLEMDTAKEDLDMDTMEEDSDMDILFQLRIWRLSFEIRWRKDH